MLCSRSLDRLPRPVLVLLKLPLLALLVCRYLERGDVANKLPNFCLDPFCRQSVQTARALPWIHVHVPKQLQAVTSCARSLHERSGSLSRSWAVLHRLSCATNSPRIRSRGSSQSLLPLYLLGSSKIESVPLHHRYSLTRSVQATSTLPCRSRATLHRAPTTSTHLRHFQVLFRLVPPPQLP